MSVLSASVSGLVLALALQSLSPPTVSDVQVGVPAVPVPKVGAGAPQFTTGELKDITQKALSDAARVRQEMDQLDQCFRMSTGIAAPDVRVWGYLKQQEANGQLVTRAKRARDASEAAIRIRQEAAAGKRTEAEVEAAELARQKAVNLMLESRRDAEDGVAMQADIQQLARDRDEMDPLDMRAELKMRSSVRAFDAADPNARPSFYPQLKIQNVSAETLDDAKGPYILVTGVVHNDRKTAAIMPPLKVATVDAEGFTLAAQTADAKASIPPGGQQRFSYVVRPMPGRTKAVEVVFGEPDASNRILPAMGDPQCSKPMNKTPRFRHVFRGAPLF